MALIHIVDDDVHVRAATSYLLASRGYTTQIYGGAEEFLAQANLDEGCVLMDVRMPDTDGFAALGRLAKRNVTIPTIMMTGHGDLNTAIKAMKLGAVDFIEKPYKESELVAAVTRALDLAHMIGASGKAARLRWRASRSFPRASFRFCGGCWAGWATRRLHANWRSARGRSKCTGRA